MNSPKAGSMLTCFALPSVSLAQTRVVCDPAGDAISSNGKGSPKIPAWLDIVQSEITDGGSDIHFTLTLNAAIRAAPAWNAVDDGGQLWWGWRLVDDLAHDTFIKDRQARLSDQCQYRDLAGEPPRFV